MRRCKLALIVLAALLALPSCQSIFEGDQAENPSWYDNPRSRSGMVTFTAMGEGPSEAGARDLALNSLLSEVSGYLGYDVVGRHYRELANFGHVESLALAIQRTSAGQNLDGSVRYYILAYAEEAVLTTQRSPEYQARVQAGNTVVELQAQALESYKRNNDVEAIRLLLEALAVSAEGDVQTGGLMPSDIAAQASGWLSNLEVRTSRARPSEGTVTVTVRRDRGLFSPAVAGATVDATFTVHGHGNDFSQLTVPFTTSSDGSFTFDSHYPLMTRSGQVVFTLGLDDELDRAAAAAGDELVTPLRQLANSVSATFRYSLPSGGDILLVTAERDIHGRVLDSSWISSSVFSYLVLEGYNVTNARSFTSDPAAALADSGSSPDWILIVDAALQNVPEQPNGEEVVYVVEGEAILYDASTLAEIHRDEITRYVTWGSDSAACIRNVFTGYGSSVAAGMMATL